MDVDLTIRGLQEAQAANNRRIAQLMPGGPLSALIKDVTTHTHRQAVAATHVDTGALRASHRMQLGTRGGSPYGRIFVDPAAINPRSGARPVVYGQIERARGGSHDFYTIARSAGQGYTDALLRTLSGQLTR